MKSFSHKDRQQNIERLKNEIFDLVIVGGGINGAGVARDAAQRGLKVALVEAKDFASGTSSRSSKLIHGGIRYLENMEFHLVFEALNERQKLIELAPHLVHPLRFLLPLYQGGRVGMFKMGLGMWLYDALSLFQAPELHERLDRMETLQRMPVLKGETLMGSYVYSDAYMDDDRLVFESLRSANEFGAVCTNYVKAVGAELDENGKVVAVKVQEGSKQWSIRGRQILSTVGPWTDLLGQSFFKDWKPRLRPTKGVHLTFHRERLPLSSAVVMAAEKRIVFAIPRHDMVIVGTTDTDFKQTPDAVVTDAEDVRYLLNVINNYFPGAKIKAEDILSSYAGVRPLVDDKSESEGKTSREHTIVTDEHDVTYVIGGKYTTYRLIAQQTLDHMLARLPIEDRARLQRCQTNQPLNPFVTVDSFVDLSAIVEDLRSGSGLSATEAQLLAQRFGREAVEIQKHFGKTKTYIELEALHAMHSTMCLNLVDFLTRRTPLFLSQKDHGNALLPLIAGTFANELSWSHSEREQQIQSVKAHESRELDWQKHL